MEDFVGVRIADAAEDGGVGKHAFEGVILGRESAREIFECRVEDFQAAALVDCKIGLRGVDMDRSAMFGAGLGEQERAIVEIEGGEIWLGG